MVNFGPLAAEIDPVVSGTPVFQQVSRIGSVNARHSSIGRQPNFVALNRGRHLYSTGRPSGWASAHILVLSIFFFFSSPNLNGRRVDVYHTSTHEVALVRIQDVGLKCAASGSLEIQDAKMMQKITISAPPQNFVGLYLRN